MIITQAHIDFYRAKKTPAALLQTRLKTQYRLSYRLYYQPPASIDLLINSQVPDPFKGKTEPHNILNFIKGWRHRKEDILVELKRMAFTPYATDPKRRTAYARRWYVKLFGQRLRAFTEAITDGVKRMDAIRELDKV